MLLPLKEPAWWPEPLAADENIFGSRIKLDLYCKGLTLAPELREEMLQKLHKVRAGLGSGLELILPGGVHCNAPVEEPFVEGSPYHLQGTVDMPRLVLNDHFDVPVQLHLCTDFYAGKTSSGLSHAEVGTLQGTYLGVYWGEICHHWTKQTGGPCQFCAVGINLKEMGETRFTPQDLKETALAARELHGTTFVHFNTGHLEDFSFLDKLKPYVDAVAEEGFLVGVQAPPHPDKDNYDKLAAMGVQNVSFCFEFFTEEAFGKYCPGKMQVYGLDGYLDTIRYCVDKFNTVNGEIIAGVEPTQASMECIDYLTDMGAVPTVCVFRPLPGTAMESVPVPTFEAMHPVYGHLYKKCSEAGLNIGVAPNVSVSIVMLPEEGRAFIDDPKAFPLARAVRTVKKKVFAEAYKHRLHQPKEVRTKKKDP